MNVCNLLFTVKLRPIREICTGATQEDAFTHRNDHIYFADMSETDEFGTANQIVNNEAHDGESLQLEVFFFFANC